MNSNMFRAQLIDKPEDFPIDSYMIDTLVSRLSKASSRAQNGLINIVHVTEWQIHQHNQEYRERDKPTDILTFPYWDDFADCPDDEVAGEILICLDHTWKKHDIPPTSEKEKLNKYYELITHGLVHMLGYDHETDDQYREMAEIEENVLRYDSH